MTTAPGILPLSTSACKEAFTFFNLADDIPTSSGFAVGMFCAIAKLLMKKLAASNLLIRFF